jgi:hypothetical protein
MNSHKFGRIGFFLDNAFEDLAGFHGTLVTAEVTHSNAHHPDRMPLPAALKDDRRWAAHRPPCVHFSPNRSVSRRFDRPRFLMSMSRSARASAKRWDQVEAKSTVDFWISERKWTFTQEHFQQIFNSKVIFFRHLNQQLSKEFPHRKNISQVQISQPDDTTFESLIGVLHGRELGLFVNPEVSGLSSGSCHGLVCKT